MAWRCRRLPATSRRRRRPRRYGRAAAPSNDEMAARLYPIVRGDELVFTGHATSDHPGDLAGHAAAVDGQQAAPNHKRIGRRWMIRD